VQTLTTDAEGRFDPILNVSAAAAGHTAVLMIPSDLCVGAKNKPFSSATTQISGQHAAKKKFTLTETGYVQTIPKQKQKTERVVQ
jgi:hypothetical protein